jgi:hypothetical protein
MGRAKGMADKGATARFDSVVGAKRSTTRPRFEKDEIFWAFAGGSELDTGTLSCVKRGENTFLFDARGHLLARLGAPGKTASIEAVLQSGMPCHKALTRVLETAGVHYVDLPENERELLILLVAWPREREDLQSAGVSRSKILELIPKHFAEKSWQLLLALDRKSPLAMHRLIRAGGPRQAASEPTLNIDSMTALGLMEYVGNSQDMQLTKDGKDLLIQRAEIIKEQSAEPTGVVARLITQIGTLDLENERFSVRVGDGDALGPRCVSELSAAGLGGQLRRAELELHEALKVKGCVLPSESYTVLVYALMAVISKGALSENDRFSLWNFYYNVVRKPMPNNW